MITVEPTGGLCNYLRVVFSYKQFAMSKGECLTVVWKVSDMCNGFFLDFFEEVPDVTFVKEANDDTKVDYKGLDSHKEYVLGNIDYSNLVLRPEMRASVDEIVSSLGNNFIAVHIRRTDHTTGFSNDKKLTSDDSFVKFIHENTCKNLYIATDNADTFKKFEKMFQSRMKALNCVRPEFSATSFRQTSLAQAIVDIFVCVRAKQFKGSYYSSFSNLIAFMRNETPPCEEEVSDSNSTSNEFFIFLVTFFVVCLLLSWWRNNRRGRT